MRLIHLLIIGSIFTLVIIGCSSGGGKNPVIPAGSDNDTIQSTIDLDNVPALPKVAADDGSIATNGVFAMYSLVLDYDSTSAELTPIRTSAGLGDVYQSDVTAHLNSLCLDCLQVVGTGLTEEDEYLEVTFRLHHPIKLPEDPSNPKISDRYDLHLFDVHGILITEGDRVFTGFTADVNGDGDPSEVLQCNPALVNNADGYTTFFDKYFDDNILFTNANLHPYRNFFEDHRSGNYQPGTNTVNGWLTISAPQGQSVFPQGDRTDDVKYIFDMEQGESLNLLFVFDACYGHSAQFSIPSPEVGSRMNPRYFLPEFHRKEAWKAYVDVTNNTLAYGDPYSTANISVTVYDWQAGMIGIGKIDYLNTPLTHISKTSDVDTVEVFVPEIISEPVQEYDSLIGSGIWSDPYVYSYTIPNELDPEGGTYYGIVAIKDTLANSTAGPIGTTRDLDLMTITDFTNYQIFPLEVAATAANVPPIAIFITDPMILEINSGDSVTFDGSESFDPDGEIVTYEWDFEFDMNGFDVMAEGPTPPPYTYISPDPSRPYPFLAALQVWDNGDPPEFGMFGVDIIVLANAPPEPEIDVSPRSPFSECDLVTLDASGSSDPDGEITRYEWDFSFDPVNDPDFTEEGSGPVVERRFSPGNHDILLKVYDDSDPPLEGITRLRLVSEPLSGMPGQVAFCDNYLLNPEDGYASHTFGSGGQKSAVLTPMGHVIACWVDEGDVSGGPALQYAKSIDGGRSFEDPIVINTNPIAGSIDNLRPTMVTDTVGNLHVGYADGDHNFYYQRYDVFSGFTDRVKVGVGDRTYGGPSIVIDIDGSINYFMPGQLLGGKVGLKLGLSTDGGVSFDPLLTVVDDGRFPSAAKAQFGTIVVAFEGRNDDIGDFSDIQVCYQRTGTTYYSPIRVVDSGINDGISTMPALVIGQDLSVHVAWQDSRQGDVSSEYDIFYSRSTTGLTFDSNVRVNDTMELPGEQVIQDYPAIGIDMMGRAFVAWRDFRDGDGGDIYLTFQRMAGMGFEPNIKINDDSSSADIHNGPPVMLISQNSGILLLWGDERNASSDTGTPFTGPSDIFFTFGKLF